MENKKKFIEELGRIFMMYSREKVEEFKGTSKNLLKSKWKGGIIKV